MEGWGEGEVFEMRKDKNVEEKDEKGRYLRQGGRVRRERAEYFILGDTGCTAAASIATEYIKRRGIVTDNNNSLQG